MTDSIRVLVVDDAIEHAQLVVEFLRSSDAWRGASMEVAGSYDSALAAMGAASYDVAFFDYWLGAQDGLTLLRDIRTRGIETPVICNVSHARFSAFLAEQAVDLF